MLVESILASVSVLYKSLDKKPVHRQWTGRDAKKAAEAYAKKCLADEEVNSVVCKSQCVLVNQ